MKWMLDDSYLKKTEGKAHKIAKRGDRPLPWWFWVNWLRPMLKAFLWDFAVMFGVDEGRAEAGYRLGIIVNGHAYVSDAVFHHRDAIIYVNDQDWTIFAVDTNGGVIPDETGKEHGAKVFWVDRTPNNAMDRYLDGRNVVD
jgi:hypothetical protein